MNLILIAGAVDAIAVAGLGFVAATMRLLGYEAPAFYQRVVPATAILCVTATVAGIIFASAKYFAA